MRARRSSARRMQRFVRPLGRCFHAAVLCALHLARPQCTHRRARVVSLKFAEEIFVNLTPALSLPRRVRVRFWLMLAVSEYFNKLLTQAASSLSDLR